jgi:beta-galactosidase
LKQLLLFATLITSLLAHTQRQVILLDKDWKFIRGDQQGAATPDFDDHNWQSVMIPHDWAISGPFDRLNDAQTVTVTEDGEKRSALRTGRTGSLPWTGVGWYRRKINVPVSQKGKRVFIEFDGAMSHAVVYLNGDSVGTWPYGYASFSFDLTDKFHFGSDNILAVRLENMEESSRWYPGAGLYRNVRLVLTEPVHVKHWGSYITTPEVNTKQAVIRVKTEIINQDGPDLKIQLKTVIISPTGNPVATKTTKVEMTDNGEVDQSFVIDHPKLWDLTTPKLYTAVSTVLVDGKLADIYRTSFGIRNIAFDNNRGFFLNGVQVKIKGVCDHHDLGPLGAAVNYRAIERQLELLKAMGCNAVRTSHNPPAPELLELCDKMGFLVMDEAFDEWKLPKCKNGYNTLFDEWAEKDLRAMIKRDRNHPCIILWSIGNEVPEQGNKDGAKTAKFLVDIVHDEDPTRLTTSGFNSIDNAIKNGLADVVDVVGINYRTFRYPQFHATHPQWKIIGSETNSTISSRGEYMFPVIERKNNYKYTNKQLSSYDLETPSWGNTPDIEFALQDANEFVAGEFVWSGFDYLGEPTPYNNDWPSHSSYFGIVDLAGIPKDRYYLYQSKWSDQKVLHLLPHWNWQGREGEITPVYCYTSYPAAELFVNGKSQGIQKKDTSRYGRYRLTWDSIRYEAGSIKVVALDEKGRAAETNVLKTAGDAYQIKLTADRKNIKSDGKDLSFITVEILDRDGNLCPLASGNIQFDVQGEGSIRGVCNGDPTNIQVMTGKEMQAFHGVCVVVVQSIDKPGNIILSATSSGLKKVTLQLAAK